MTKSYIIVSKKTGNAVYETANQSILDIVNTDMYKIVDVLDYLTLINGKQQGGV